MGMAQPVNGDHSLVLSLDLQGGVGIEERQHERHAAGRLQRGKRRPSLLDHLVAPTPAGDPACSTTFSTTPRRAQYTPQSRD